MLKELEQVRREDTKLSQLKVPSSAYLWITVVALKSLSHQCPIWKPHHTHKNTQQKNLAFQLPGTTEDKGNN